MRLIRAALRLFFDLLYHQFAWSYDLVAGTVSLGRWQAWIMTSLPYIQGERVLELGHGPGHLQRRLLAMGRNPVGLDESRQMGLQARKRLIRSGEKKNRLVRGLAEALPFPQNSFETVIATFPSDYIFNPMTLAEVHRTLVAGGRFVLLPVAWITGMGLLERFLAWVFRVTGQAPDTPIDVLSEQIKPVFQSAGFRILIEPVVVRRSTVLIVLATK
jgi:ubiquinone/menaquinone biosynthesis C-methylase UbiE